VLHPHRFNTQKGPVSHQAAGPPNILGVRATLCVALAILRREKYVPHYGKPCSAKPLPPIERVRRGLGHLWLEEPIARLDEVVRRIQDNDIPFDTQPPEVPAPNAVAARRPSRSSAVSNVRRRYDAGKCDRLIAMLGKPPRSQLELRHGRRVEERRPMQISQRLDEVVIGCINDANFVRPVCGK